MRILMIGAHPDDCDGCGGGAALKYLARGDEVRFLSVSDGRCGHQEMAPDALAARRFAETQAVAAKMGIIYDVWDLPDGEMEATLGNRRRMVRYIRAFSPDLVITHRTNDYHPDHRNAALLVQDASYLLIVPHYCPDVPAMTAMPVIAFFADRFQQPPFRADVVVPIDEVMEKRYEIIACHESQYFEWLPFSKGVLDTVPADRAARLEWLREPRIPRDHVLRPEDLNVHTPSNQSEYRAARAAALYRDTLRAQYGDEADKVCFADAFQISEYGKVPKRSEYSALFPI